MARMRPKGVLALGWASIDSARNGRTEHVPTSEDYPDTVVRRISFMAGGDLGWRISALVTPRATPAPWKIVVITGAPSWGEYWAPVMAALPSDREMVVVDRPGFAASEPEACVPDIRRQALALSPLLDAAPGQKILLVGQSYGAAIASLMAAARPGSVAGVVMLSSFLGEPGPVARWLVSMGSLVLGVIPRDLRNAVMEVSGQAEQLAHMHEALEQLDIPVHLIHGDHDDFAPIGAAERLAAEARTRHPIRFERVAGASHFMNDGPAETLLAVLEACIPPDEPAAPVKTRWRLPNWLKWPHFLPALHGEGQLA